MITLRRLFMVVGVVYACSQLSAQPVEFDLGPAQPNPFDTTGTLIEYSLAHQAYIMLWISNSVDTVRVLVSEEKTAGNHEIAWDTRDDNDEQLEYGTYWAYMVASVEQPVWESPPLPLYLTELESVPPLFVPINTILSCAYPNPFNPSTTIEYSLARSGDAIISVYNINGQLIDVIHDGFMQAGQHTATWTASDLSSGIYFVELLAGEACAVMKVSYVK